MAQYAALKAVNTELVLALFGHRANECRTADLKGPGQGSNRAVSSGCTAEVSRRRRFFGAAMRPLSEFRLRGP